MFSRFLLLLLSTFFFFFFNDTATTEIYTLSLHDALPICSANSELPPRKISGARRSGETNGVFNRFTRPPRAGNLSRSEEHTSELQSHLNLVCRLLLEKKKTHKKTY